MKIKRKLLCVVAAVSALFCLFCGMPASAIQYRNLDKEVVGMTDEAIEASLISMGNQAYIHNVFKKAEAGEKITVAAIGGSITYGSGTLNNGGTQEDLYIAHIAGWFREKFPKAEVNFVNAGVPATGSLFGVFRMNEDVWQHDPDLLIIEYAVNEGGTRSTDESTETLIRRAYRNHCAVCSFFMCKPGGWNSQEEKKAVCQHYEVPMVSYKNGMNRLEQQGAGSIYDFDADGTHPNADGQAAAGLFLNNWLNKAYESYTGSEETVPELPKPYISDELRYVQGYYSDTYVPTSLGSFKESDQANMYAHFNNGWIVTDGGQEELVFDVEAKRVYLPFRTEPSMDGRIVVCVNGVPVGVYQAKSEWDAVSYPLIFESDTVKKLTVSVKLIGGKHFSVSGIVVAY